ncbi:DUF58 domain-containing protein [Nesterenkonia ebinurensis]|uniref:DUF58 domain-containing protein n=1 Tax=Nesterenkonia ebinurensis TaxID=2608252 RepID=UPI00123DFD1C|nr:DUF58 domain-containing protein [Nesterenkonia ebinurensis]
MSGTVESDPEGPSTASSGRWLLTHAHLRAVLIATLGIFIALVAARPDALILVAPLALAAAWAVLARPAGKPWATARLARQRTAEGEHNEVIVQGHGLQGADLAVASLAPTAWMQRRPHHGSQVHIVEGSDAQLTVGADPLRWGNRSYGTTLVGAVGPWGAHCWGPVPLTGRQQKVLPAAEHFDTSAPAPHPRGLVGHHRSTRPGQGSEFASIRHFQWGDRLKNIHWPRSLRTGELHVTSSYADQDTHVALILDAQNDLGSSEGTGGISSTLDSSVRAAAAIGEHFTHQGDRVSLQVISGAMPQRLNPGTGPKHYRRLLDVLAAAVPAPERRIEPEKIRLGLRAGTLVVIVSALVSEAILTRAAALARSGMTVLAVDVLSGTDPQLKEADAYDQLAWRLRMLEREREIRRAVQAGVAVVDWRGPGTMDTVLRMLSRRGRAGAR